MPARSLARWSLGVLALVLAAASSTLAVAAVGTIPAEADAALLPGSAITAIVGDVDGDGVRELVRLVPRENNAGLVAVEVVSVDASGPTQHGVAPLRRTAAVDEQLGGRPPADADGMLPTAVHDPARLLAWRLRGEERVLAITIGLNTGCCLTVWQVGLDERGQTMVQLLPGTAGRAAHVRVADLDGDGTDEIVVAEPADLARPAITPIAVFRWSGGRFHATRGSAAPSGLGPLAALGNTDGLPGDELGLVATSLDGRTSLLHRISLGADEEPRIEHADIPFAGQVVGLDGPSGGRIALASADHGTALLSWPTGERAVSVEATSLRSGSPLAVLGSGDDVRLLLLRDGTVDVLGPTLIPRQGIVGSPASALFRTSGRAPYVGALPGGLPNGQPAVIFRGRMVTAVSTQPDRSLELLRDLLVASLPGMAPIGVIGPGGAWMALAESAERPFDATRSGGQLTLSAGPQRGTVTSVTRADAVLTAEVDDGLITPEVLGAVHSDRQPARPIILARDAFDLRIGGPAGSSVQLEVGPLTSTAGPIGPSGSADVRVTGLVRTGNADGNQRFNLRLTVVTPSGHGYGNVWEVQLIRTAPSLEVAAPMLPLSFDVPVTGRTTPGSSVSVDGRPVEVAANGSFSVTVPAGPLPGDVRIEAIDLVGNRSERVLSVVGFVDYRRLPWVPIVAGLTVGLALLLYLRAPRPRPVRKPTPEDDARLEEIG